jgi:hypothetical protein
MPLQVLQLYKTHLNIPKAFYTPRLREKIFQWPEKITSTQGYFQEGVLYLPDRMKRKLSSSSAQMIVLTDDNPLTVLQQRSSGERKFPEWYEQFNHRTFTIQTIPLQLLDWERNHFELFEIHQHDDLLQLWFDYERNEFLLGSPRRENHLLFNLKINKPIRFRINGTGKSELEEERLFYEFDYILDFKGTADRIVFKAPSQLVVDKKVPQTDKEINERKAIY